MICHGKFHVFHKAFLVGHLINQGRKSYSGRHACLTKEKVTEMLRASSRHHLSLRSTMHILALYLCWRSNLNHSQKIITKCDGIITKCDGLLLQIATAFLLQSATRFITNCDRYYKVRHGLLQIATVQTFSLTFFTFSVCLLYVAAESYELSNQCAGGKQALIY